MLRRRVACVLLLFAAGCANDASNPFGGAVSRPASADAAILFLSGSWASEPGMPRELLALSSDGSKLERLTTCALAKPQACDFLGVSPSPLRGKVAAVRSVAGADPRASTLYFMDLNRSVEKRLFDRRRVASVDWSPDGGALIYSSSDPQAVSGATDASGNEDLFVCLPDGTSDQSVTQTPTIRERAARWGPTSNTAVFERIDESGVGRIQQVHSFGSMALTSGAAGGPALPGTSYVVGADADPAYSPTGAEVAFRRLTGVDSSGLGTWDLMAVSSSGGTPRTVVSGAVYRSAPDWGPLGILFVETDPLLNESRLVLVQPDGSGRTVLRTEPAGYGMSSPRWIPGS